MDSELEWALLFLPKLYIVRFTQNQVTHKALPVIFLSSYQPNIKLFLQVLIIERNQVNTLNAEFKLGVILLEVDVVNGQWIFMVISILIRNEIQRI